MRVSSLSDPRIIDLLSKYFVPVWVSRDDYQRQPSSEAEKAELLRLDRDRARRGLKGGRVCVFIVAPNGDVLATQPVQLAYKPENLLPFLQKIIAEQKLNPRRQEAIQASAAKPADIPVVKQSWEKKGSRFIHIWTRLDAGENRGLSNDRVELRAEQWKTFLPPPQAKPGTSWSIPEEITHQLFQYGYPPGPQWTPKDGKVLLGKLQATLAASSDEQACIRLQGTMELKFPLGRPTEGRITARFIGLAHADRKKQTLTSLALVSERADYVWYWQGKPVPQRMRIALELEP